VQQTESENTLLTLEPTVDPPAARAKIASNKVHIAKWQAEVDRDAEEAHKLEAQVDHAEHEAMRFDIGEALLQIAVVLASITLLTQQSRYVWSGVTLALIGLVAAASAFFVK
jgi:hypothetical protein